MAQKKKQVSERRLYETKWWDYRPLCPESATAKFILEFIRQVGRYYERFGEEGGRQVLMRGMARQLREHGNFQKWRDYSILNELRQFADTHMMPYPRFWELAIESHEALGYGTKRRAHWGGKNGGPKHKTDIRYIPTSGFKTKALLARVLDAYQAENVNKVLLSKHPAFSALNYNALKLQKEYYHYVLAAVVWCYPHSHVEVVKRLIKEGKLSKIWLASQSQ